jgi:hypothetical protein
VRERSESLAFLLPVAEWVAGKPEREQFSLHKQTSEPGNEWADGTNMRCRRYAIIALCSFDETKFLLFDVIAGGIFCRLWRVFFCIVLMRTVGARREQEGGGERAGRDRIREINCNETAID